MRATYALILLAGVSFALILIGLVSLLAAMVPSGLGERLLLWGVGLVLVGAAGVVLVAATLA
jgi:hypothetical protein